MSHNDSYQTTMFREAFPVHFRSNFRYIFIHHMKHYNSSSKNRLTRGCLASCFSSRRWWVPYKSKVGIRFSFNLWSFRNSFSDLHSSGSIPSLASSIFAQICYYYFDKFLFANVNQWVLARDERTCTIVKHNESRRWRDLRLATVAFSMRLSVFNNKKPIEAGPISTWTKILFEGTFPISSKIIGSAVMQSPHQS